MLTFDDLLMLRRVEFARTNAFYALARIYNAMTFMDDSAQELVCKILVDWNWQEDLNA